MIDVEIKILFWHGYAHFEGFVRSTDGGGAVEIQAGDQKFTVPGELMIMAIQNAMNNGSKGATRFVAPQVFPAPVEQVPPQLKPGDSCGACGKPYPAACWNVACPYLLKVTC